MLKWQADFFLATNVVLECMDLICLNYGTCLNFGSFTSNNAFNEICICADGFFGTNCEFTDDDLVISVVGYAASSNADDDHKKQRNSYSVDVDYQNQPEYETLANAVEVIETREVFRLENEDLNVPALGFLNDRRLSRRGVDPNAVVENENALDIECVDDF